MESKKVKKPYKATIVVGTANLDKLKELKKLLKDLNVRLLPITHFSPVPKVIEDGNTFEKNACKKARVYSKLSNFLTLSDDSGLCVDALNGKPGVYSARFAGPGCTYEDNNQKLLRKLKNTPKPQRKSTFYSTIALYKEGKKIKVLEGSCKGSIAEKMLGKKGFGFDPVFIPYGSKKTFAQMTSEEKNKVSHRSKALKLTKSFLKKYLKK